MDGLTFLLLQTTVCLLVAVRPLQTYPQCDDHHGDCHQSFVPAPPGKTPDCARPGSTFCENIEHYPTHLIHYLLERGGFNVGSFLVDESLNEYRGMNVLQTQTGVRPTTAAPIVRPTTQLLPGQHDHRMVSRSAQVPPLRRTRSVYILYNGVAASPILVAKQVRKIEPGKLGGAQPQDTSPEEAASWSRSSGRDPALSNHEAIHPAQGRDEWHGKLDVRREPGRRQPQSHTTRRGGDVHIFPL